MTDVYLAPQSLRDLRQLGDVYKGADKTLQKRLRTGLQNAAKPLAAQVLREGSASLPSRGGLRARVAGARAGVTASLGGRRVSVSIRLANRERDSLGALDTGVIRHPVFGHSDTWVSQQIRPHQFSDAFDRGAPLAEARVRLEMQKALDEIAREA